MVKGFIRRRCGCNLGRKQEHSIALVGSDDRLRDCGMVDRIRMWHDCAGAANHTGHFGAEPDVSETLQGKVLPTKIILDWTVCTLTVAM